MAQHRFQKGVSGNPGGRAPLPPEIKQMNRETGERFLRLCNEILAKDLEQLKEIKSRPGATVLEVMIAAVAIKAINTGDDKRLETIMQRLIGKTVQPIDIEGSISLPQVNVSIPSNGREKP